MEEQPRTIAPLALRPREAAAALNISPRTLWSLTKKGIVPHTRQGGVVLYPVAALQQWLTEQTQNQKQR